MQLSAGLLYGRADMIGLNHFFWGRFGIIETREDLFRLKKVKSILERKKKKAKEKKMAAAREKLV